MDGTTQIANALTQGGDVPLLAEMDLSLLDDTQDRAPTTVVALLGGADPDETITFSIDGTDVWTLDADDGGTIYAASIPVPSSLAGTPTAAGDHTLTATGVRTASATFSLARDPLANPTEQAADTDPVAVEGRGNRWALQDPMPGGLGSWVMTPSPSSMTEPDPSKIVDVDHSTHPLDGQFHVSSVEDRAKQWQWTGYCPNQDFYDQLTAYAALNRRIWVLDHRGRAWKVTISHADLIPRKRQVGDDGTWNDWAHDYTVTATIYDARSWVAP